MKDSSEFIERASTFFLGLTGIGLPTIAMPGVKIGGRLKLLRDAPAIGRLVGTHADRIGSLEATFLQHHAAALIYAHEKVQVDPSCIPQWINGLLIQRLAEVRSWLLKLWLVKDNAVDPDMGWMAVSHDGDFVINNNHWAASYSKADGSAELTQFSKRELQQAEDVPIEAADVSEGRAIPLYVAGASEQKPTKLSYTSLRAQRFLYFVDGARATRDVAIKIANYCSGLEAIVSTSHTELTHQVAERIAALLHPSGQARLDTFRAVKQAYALRSKAVHGAVFKDKDQEQLVDTAIAIDQICREVALAYFSTPEFQDAANASSEVFNEFWLRKLFL